MSLLGDFASRGALRQGRPLPRPERHTVQSFGRYHYCVNVLVASKSTARCMPCTVLALVLGSLEAKVALSSALGGGMQIQGGGAPSAHLFGRSLTPSTTFTLGTR